MHSLEKRGISLLTIYLYCYQIYYQKNKLNDEEEPKKIKIKNLLFASTGTIGEKFPEKKISEAIPHLVNNIKYVQNKYIWVKSAMGILTTDTRPKLSMDECKIGNTSIKIYGLAKGSGMIYPDMATTLGFIFTDAKINSNILKQLLKKIFKIHLTQLLVMEIPAQMIWLVFFQQDTQITKK